LLIITAIISKIHPLLFFVLSIASPIFMSGYFIALDQHIKTNLMTNNNLLDYIQDKNLINRLFPFIVLNFLNSLPGGLLLYLNITTGLLFWSVVIFSNFVSILFMFSLPQIIFQNRSLLDTIPLNIKAFYKNFFVFIVVSVLIFILTILSLVLLVLPFIFITLPILFTSSYIIYITIFESIHLPYRKQKPIDEALKNI
jgi:hypothetical protein